MRDDGSSEGNESKPRFTDLPEALQRLADAMMGVDPHWCLDEWLQMKAEDEIEMLNLDLDRVRLQTEQRLFRIESLTQRLRTTEDGNVDRAQRNLFDCFDIVERGLANSNSDKSLNQPTEDFLEPHPASYLTNLLPGGESDDPLLAITAQSILLEISRITTGGCEFAPLEIIAKTLFDWGITEEEIEEAIDYLLMQDEIHEIENNCFVIND